MYTNMTQDILSIANPSRAEKAKAAAEQAEEMFMVWADMTPAEKLRAQYLADHDMTEEELAALDEEERAKIEEEIADYIKQQLADWSEKEPPQTSPESSWAGELAMLSLEK